MNATFVQAANLTRPYLETLTTPELLRLADTVGIDIPPELDRIFIVEELLEADFEDEDENDAFEDIVIPPRKLAEKRLTEPVPLPKQYNITFLEVMLRDPLWVFTFWEVKNAEKELYEHELDFEGYQLRIVSENALEEPFTIPVGARDDAWYIGFPPEGGRFTVELCVKKGEEAITLAVSRPFSMPRLFNPTVDTILFENPLIRLSGLADFAILRNVDRESRVKRA
jgi:hypothetical protein